MPGEWRRSAIRTWMPSSVQQYGDVGYDQKAAIMDQIEGIISRSGGRGTGIKAALTTLSQALAGCVIPYQETNANIVMNAFKV